MIGGIADLIRPTTENWPLSMTAKKELKLMKTNLFFFSATGNSLIVAKDIAAKLPETQIFSIPKVINQEIDLNADNIGFIFPVYFSGMPRIVIDFINKLESSKTKYIFAICTCGAFPMGTLLQAQKQLRIKRFDLKCRFFNSNAGELFSKIWRLLY